MTVGERRDGGERVVEVIVTQRCYYNAKVSTGERRRERRQMGLGERNLAAVVMR